MILKIVLLILKEDKVNCKVSLSASAEEDLFEIYKYIYQNDSEENADKVVKEIHNTIQNSNKNNNTTNNTDFLKRIDKKPEVVEEIIIDDDGEDWSAIPAFLRRKKN